MSLASCPRCWDDACVCADGHGWLGYPADSLEQIAASVAAAIARKPAHDAEQAAVRAARPLPTAADYGRSMRIVLDDETGGEQ